MLPLLLLLLVTNAAAASSNRMSLMRGAAHNAPNLATFGTR